jgi:cytoskeletal protein RodZ
MPESIGQQLKKEREARYLTLEKASEVTRIRVVFLRALEADDYSALPSAAQGRGFLRNYADYLELNIDEMIAELQRHVPSAEVSGPLPQVNLVETEIPPLVNEQDKEPAAPFFSRWFGRRPKPESAADEATVEEQTLSVEDDQPGVKEEAQPGLLSKFEQLFRSRPEKIEPEPEPVVEADAPRFVPTQPADIIFAEIGSRLRARREMISLTVEEVERHTKLRAVFVKALEDGAFDRLPSSVQTRGMLANYSTFLDLDTDAILLRFADGLQARRHEKYSETPREKIQTEVTTSMPFLRSFIAGDLVFGVVMAMALIGLAIWGVGRMFATQEAEPAAPAVVNVIGGAPTATSLPGTTFAPVDENLLPPGTETLTAPEASPPAASTANVAVNVFAVERVFVRISVDGKIVFEGRLAPRESKLFEAEDQVVILTGNAAALRITYNGRDLGFMGNTGEVVTRVYLITGIATPTATIPPTPTSTPPVTPTQTPTRTPAVTPTQTPAGGG